MLIVLWCEANAIDNVRCNVYNAATKSLEKYCPNYHGPLPKDCPNQSLVIEPSDVIRLKVDGCNRYTVVDLVNNFTNLRDLDISYSSYESLDWLSNLHRPERLEKFNASYNYLIHIGKFLNNMPGLIELDLSHNKLNDDTMFDGVKKLKMIHLSHNNFSSPFKGFKNLVTLEYVDLRDNHLTVVPDFYNNENMKTVDLGGNDIREFSCYNIKTIKNATLHFSWEWVESFTAHSHCAGHQIDIIRDRKYEGIKIAENKCDIHMHVPKFENLQNVTVGPKTLVNATHFLSAFEPSIRKIDVSGNFIGQLNANTMDRFQQLTHLILSDTKLESFDFSLIGQYLSHLDISLNNLKSINNTWMLNRFRLIELNIAGNNLERSNTTQIIKYLTPSIVKLDLSGNVVGNITQSTFLLQKNLERLNLSNTQLMFDTNGNPFQSLSQLISLDISHNNLEKVNFSISMTLNQLTYFNASECHIQNTTEIIQRLGQSMRYLDLSGNFIGTVTAQTFRKLINLEYLRLSRTNLINIDARAFEKQWKLVYLDISNNQVQEFNMGFFSSDDLKWINLAFNDLTTIQNYTDSRFPGLIGLDISNNQFECSYLKQNIPYFKYRLSGEHWKQKPDRDCRSTGQGISDFLSSIVNKIKIW